MAVIDDFLNATPFASANQPDNWREKLQAVSFKGQQFFAAHTDTDGNGRRIVVHEYPLQDNPFVEDMGGQTTYYTIVGFLVGDTWEKDRDNLRKLCAEKGPGILVHPDFGQITCVCTNAFFTESKTQRGKYVDLELQFVETPKKTTTKYVDTAANVRTNGVAAIYKLQTIFNAAYTITNLPNYVYNFVNSKMGELLGVSLTQTFGIAEAFTTLKNVNFSVPTQLSTAIVNYNRAFNSDYDVDKPNATFTVTPKTALKQYINNATVELEYPPATSKTYIAQNTACRHMETLYKQCAVIEATIAATYIDFASYNEARAIWDQINVLLDTHIRGAADSSNGEAYQTLKGCKAAFVQDIKVRSPELTRVKYRKVPELTPSLVIAYDEYEDINRAEEIINRNGIQHPLFVVSDRLELLTD